MFRLYHATAGFKIEFHSGFQFPERFNYLLADMIGLDISEPAFRRKLHCNGPQKKGGIVVDLFEDNLSPQAVEIGDIIYEVDGELIHNYVEYIVRSAASYSIDQTCLSYLLVIL